MTRPRPKKPCAVPLCGVLVTVGTRFCEAHQKENNQIREARRDQRGRHLYGWKWRKARKAFLMEHPLCTHCTERGKHTPANEVDHIEAHKGDEALFWSVDNWQALCKPCHQRKTYQEDGALKRKLYT